MVARFAQLRFPHERVLLARTRLAYVHLQNLLTDAKRDRAARVFGYVAVWLPEELLVLYLQEGELVTATSTRDGRDYRSLSLRDALHRVPNAAEYGEICFHQADDEQLACMFAAQTSPSVPWPSELRVSDANAVLAHLLAAMFDGVLELERDEARHYVTFRHGLPRRVFAASEAAPSTPTDVLRLFWPTDVAALPRRWGTPSELPVQASPALIAVYRSLVRGLATRLEEEQVRGAVELVELARQSLTATHPSLLRFASSDVTVRDPVTTAAALTRAMAAWINEILWAAALPDHLSPETLLRDTTRERRHVLQSAGFFEAVPWKVV